MKKKILILLAEIVALIAINCLVVFFWIYYVNPWHQNRSNLDTTVFVGAEIQVVADSYNAQFHHYPTADELTRLLQQITLFNEGVSAYRTNKFVQKFDDTGGWLYNEGDGSIALNCHTRDTIGFQTWLDPSKISFRPVTGVDINHYGKPKVIDYSWVNDRLTKMKPQIEETIKDWAAKNNHSQTVTNNTFMRSGDNLSGSSALSSAN